MIFHFDHRLTSLDSFSARDHQASVVRRKRSAIGIINPASKLLPQLPAKSPSPHRANDAPGFRCASSGLHLPGTMTKHQHPRCRPREGGDPSPPCFVIATDRATTLAMCPTHAVELKCQRVWVPASAATTSDVEWTQHLHLPPF